MADGVREQRHKLMPYHVYSNRVPLLRLAGGEFSATEPVVVDELTEEMEFQRDNLRIVEVDEEGTPVPVQPEVPQPVGAEDYQKALGEIERLQTYVSDLENDLATHKEKAKTDVASLKEKHSDEIAKLNEAHKAALTDVQGQLAAADDKAKADVTTLAEKHSQEVADLKAALSEAKKAAKANKPADAPQ